MVLKINLNFDCVWLILIGEKEIQEKNWELLLAEAYVLSILTWSRVDSGELLFTEAEMTKSSVVTTKWGITYIDLPENHTEGRT